MSRNLTQKILAAHLVAGALTPGKPIVLRVDQVLTQDASGTMAWLQFEAMGLDRVRVPTAVSYVDHNTLQTDFRNADDHRFLQTAAARYGAYFSKPGNGICHQVHLERFAKPGTILLGSDSHAPTAGGMGALAVGVGGLDIASVMAGQPWPTVMPRVLGVRLTGDIQRPWVTAMDVILEILRLLTVKGGVGRVIEYYGPGAAALSLTERATIANMGAELGATTSVFAADARTLAYLKAQGRAADYGEIGNDDGALYDEHLGIDLSRLEPQIARPSSPDNVVKIREIAGTRVDQVCIGSCTNSSFPVMMGVADVLRGRAIAPWVSLTINPGSKQVYEMLARAGAIADMIAAGARLLESACGPCIGMGQTPATNAVTVRSFNRNFPGRCGSKDAFVYLANPYACAVMAITGTIVDPRVADIRLEARPDPEEFLVRDNLLIAPQPDDPPAEVVRGPNIKAVPVPVPVADALTASILLKLGDNISTDEISPAGAKVLPLRSNVPALAEFTFANTDETFVRRARQAGRFLLVAGENYGQGSSREHAALAPMFLGLKAVLAKSFARIHRANLINYGVVPLTFADPAAYDNLEQGDTLSLSGLRGFIAADGALTVMNETKKMQFEVTLPATERERQYILAGGLLAWIKSGQGVASSGK